MMNSTGWLLILAKIMFGAELFIAELTLCASIKKKDKFLRRLIPLIIVDLLIMALFPMPIAINERYGGAYGILVYTIFFSMTVFTLLLCYEENVWNLLYIACVAFSVEHIASCVNSFFSLWIEEVRDYGIVTQGQSNVLNFFSYVISLSVIYVAAYFLLGKTIKYVENLQFVRSTVAFLTLVNIVVNVGFIMIYFEKAAESTLHDKAYIYVFSIIADIIIIGMQLSMYESAVRTRDLSLMDQLLKVATEQYQNSLENKQKLNIMCHDLKYIVRKMEEDQRKTGNYENQSQIDEIKGVIRDYEVRVETGNETLDVILTEKHALCQREGIQFTCIVDGAALDFMDKIDMYVMFGNLIDNSIKAVRMIDNEAYRAIQISVSIKKGFVLISTENRYSEQIVFEEGLPLTTQSDKDNHGFGMKSIQFIVNKYNGTLNLTPDNGIFLVDILLPINQKKLH